MGNDSVRMHLYKGVSPITRVSHHSLTCNFPRDLPLKRPLYPYIISFLTVLVIAFSPVAVGVPFSVLGSINHFSF
jgi:hypothetical protein